MTDPEGLKEAMKTALRDLKDNPTPTYADVRKTATQITALMTLLTTTIDRNELVKQMEAAINLQFGESTTLEPLTNPFGHN